MKKVTRTWGHSGGGLYDLSQLGGDGSTAWRRAYRAHSGHARQWVADRLKPLCGLRFWSVKSDGSLFFHLRDARRLEPLETSIAVLRVQPADDILRQDDPRELPNL